MSIKSILKKWLGRNNPPIHRPQAPMPPRGQIPINQFTQGDGDYSEAEVSLQKLYGFSTTFGNQKTVQIFGGQAAEVTQSQSYIVGTGKRVSSIEDVGGVCPICNAQAVELYNAGWISIQDMELRSIYDKESSARCDSCGMNGCNRHIRPVQLPDGQTMQLCVNCQVAMNHQIKKALKRQLIKNCFGILFAPLIDRGEE